MTAIQDSLPIDEMLDELRVALEAFEKHPSKENSDAIRMETWRIENRCNALLEDFWK